MTVKQARDTLQEEIEDLCDQEVQQMIDWDFRFCDALLDVIMASNGSMLTNYGKQI